MSVTSHRRAEARARLEASGYLVTEVEADPSEASNVTEDGVPTALAECLESSELCVFLLPDDQDDDGLIGASAATSGAQDKPIICIVSGDRTEYPQGIEDHADSVIRECNESFDEAIGGKHVWQAPDGSPVPPRKIKHVICQ